MTENDTCWKITEDDADDVPMLECTHEEADTRMILHSKFSQGPVVVYSDDTDVFILLLGHLEEATRVVDMNSIKSCVTSLYDEKILPALIGLHAFTGCDSSSFAGKEKIKALNLLKKHPEFISSFEDLGKSWFVTEDLINDLTRLVCAL